MNKLVKLLFLLFLFGSCSDDPVETVFFDLDTRNGVFIACEGNFMYGNSSLSFYNKETGKASNQLFYARNNAPLGDVAQSLALQNNILYIVINNSGKIVAVDSKTVAFNGVITGLTSPRYIHFVSDEKAYVSDLYANHISIINPVTLEITGKIDLGNHTSEQMVQVENHVFVSSWSFDEYLLILDNETDAFINKIKVPFQPKEIMVDKNSKIWVLSQGSTEGFSQENILPALSRIDPVTFTIEQIYRFEEGELPAGLEMNNAKDTLFYINAGVCKMAVDSRHLPDSAFIKPKKLFYSLGISPENDEVYISDAVDYTQNALIYRYSQRGELLDSFRVGINPSYFLF